MSGTVLNEHDANQGAQSRGEFLGMTGNSGWWLLGTAGVSMLLVIVLWGAFGVSLLLCVLAGVILCSLSVAYVFTLKNNRPEHYDTDFFEAALIEAGVIELEFGPRKKAAVNPFAEPIVSPADRSEVRRNGSGSRKRGNRSAHRVNQAPMGPALGDSRSDRRVHAERKRSAAEESVAAGVVSAFQAELAMKTEQLEEALAEREED